MSVLVPMNSHCLWVWSTAVWKFFFSFISQWARASLLSRMHDHTQTHHNQYDSSGQVIRPSQMPLADNKQHSLETDIDVTGGIRNRKPIKRAAAHPLLGTRTHWNWRYADVLVYMVEWSHVLPYVCERNPLFYIWKFCPWSVVALFGFFFTC